MRLITKIMASTLALHAALALSKPVPNAPDGCTPEELYCVHTEAVGTLQGHVKLQIWAYVSKDDYSAEEAFNIYFDLDRWGDFGKLADDPGILDFKQTFELEESKGNPDHFLHYTHYFSRAPRIIGGKSEIRAVTEYLRDNEFDAAYSYRFQVNADPENIYSNLPHGEPDLAGAIGVKMQKGYVVIDADFSEEYLLIYVLQETRPEYDVLPNVAKKFIGEANEALLQGMFYPSED